MKIKSLSVKEQQILADRLRKVLLDGYTKPIFKVSNLASELIKVKVFASGCGDRLFVDFRFDPQERLVIISYSGEGCVIFLATVELLFRQIFGKNKIEIQKIVDEFKNLLHKKQFDTKKIGPLVLLQGSPSLETRNKCFRMAVEVVEKILRF